MTHSAHGDRPRVVIVGAGFGGLTLARRLRNAPVEVVLIDRENFHTFQPLLYQVATAGLEPEEIAHAVRGIFQRQRNVRFLLGTVSGVDLAQRAVRLADGARVPYDFLALSAGATTNYFGVEGAAEHSFPLKRLTDSVRLRSHIIRLFEQADRDPALIDAGYLDVVVVGGGPTGVETAGALVELFDRVLRKDYPHLAVDRARVRLIEATPDVLNAFHPSLRAYAARELARRGVTLHMNRQVVRATATAVHLSDGTTIPTRTLIWAAGVRTSPLAETLGLEQTRGGRIVVQQDLSVPGHPSVFVIGDLAGSMDETGTLHPQVAPLAMQGATHVAKQIRNRLRGRPTTAFRYRDKGIMATIGRNAAVTELGPGLRTTGFIAWLMWLVLHLVMLIGFRNRLQVLTNWAWNYFTYDRSARLILDLDPEGPVPPPTDGAETRPEEVPSMASLTE